MTKLQMSVREKLIGKPLIGFDTKAAVVRTPRVKAGLSEIKPKA